MAAGPNVVTVQKVRSGQYFRGTDAAKEHGLDCIHRMDSIHSMKKRELS